jgi:ATP-dependent Lon protease
MLFDTARSEPGNPSRWRRLAVLERVSGRVEDADRHAVKAAALEEAGPFSRHPGRVLSAAAYRFVGKTKGLMHELWADRHPVESGRGGGLDPAHLHGNLAPELIESTKNAFIATRQYVRAKFPHLARDLDDYRYSFKVTKEDEPSGGLSAGLPTALAFFSLFVGRPVPDDVAMTGTLVADAHDVLAVRNVGDIEPKIKGAYNRDLRILVVPTESRPEVERSWFVPREVSAEVVRYAATLDEALEIVYGHQVWEW